VFVWTLTNQSGGAGNVIGLKGGKIKIP